MKTEGTTKLQREALEHVEKARQEGWSIGAYARAHESIRFRRSRSTMR
jgi:hypothetical protein